MSSKRLDLPKAQIPIFEDTDVYLYQYILDNQLDVGELYHDLLERARKFHNGVM